MADLEITTFFLDKSKKRAVRIEAAKRGITMSDLLREIVSNAIDSAPFFGNSAQENTQIAKHEVEAQP